MVWGSVLTAFHRPTSPPGFARVRADREPFQGLVSHRGSQTPAAPIFPTSGPSPSPVNGILLAGSVRLTAESLAQSEEAHVPPAAVAGASSWGLLQVSAAFSIRCAGVFSWWILSCRGVPTSERSAAVDSRGCVRVYSLRENGGTPCSEKHGRHRGANAGP